jgi:1-aminocyclopropane-1-carboxylate deaminase/D-cysteine desulfhydrase-like pyridoxal-dependent ACC family enzyme
LARRPIWIWADALLPGARWGGGNKAAVLGKQLSDLKAQGHQAVVSAGSMGSNHARSLALACCDYALECHLVLYPLPRASDDGPLRCRQMNEAGAILHFIQDASELSATMISIVEKLEVQGRTPYYWHSDGDPRYALPAHRDAAYRMLEAWSNRNIHPGEALGAGAAPDVVFLATGTGRTQAGLLMGLPEATRLQGISIARPAERVRQDIEHGILNFLASNADLGVTDPTSRIYVNDHHRQGGYGHTNSGLTDPTSRIYVNDHHRQGGYGHYDPQKTELSRQLSSLAGIEFDPIYTTKAYAGMCALLDAYSGQSVLFWHTGPKIVTKTL